MARLPQIKSGEQLGRLIDEIGFLPLFEGILPGFSVMELTREMNWWSDCPESDPWHWREEIAREGTIAYGKLFRKKSGFVSREWYPRFANFRRNGYDFDARYEDGLSPYKEKRIMDQFERQEFLFSYELKELAGFGKGGEKGFEGAMANLQMQGYLVIRGMAKRRNRAGKEYGWPVSYYSTSESLFGEAYVRSAYGEAPEESAEKITDHLQKLLPYCTREEIERAIR